MRRLLAVGLLGLALVASGCGKVEAPDVTGRSLEQAEVALAAAGLKVGAVSYQEGLPGRGAVASQEPKAGKHLKPGKGVDLVIAGPAPVRVPDLSGMDRGEAMFRLAEAGLRLGEVVDSDDSTYTPFTIVSQEPKPWEKADKGSKVKVFIAIPPEPDE